MSFFGFKKGDKKIISVANNGGKLEPSQTIGDITLNWTSDKKYIMWKEGTKLARNPTDFSLWSVTAEKAFDGNAAAAFGLATLTTLT